MRIEQAMNSCNRWAEKHVRIQIFLRLLFCIAAMVAGGGYAVYHIRP
jgi:hypothetical protein